MKRIMCRTETDCFRAALAALLGVAHGHVPDFMDTADVTGWWYKLRDWCFARGVYPVQLDPSLHTPSGQHLAIGETDSGVPHCVVMDGDTQVHDPKKNGTGLVRFDRYVVLTLTHPEIFYEWKKSCE